MRREPIIAHQICTAAIHSCQSAARLQSKPPPYCHWLCGQRITILNRPLLDSEWDLVRAFARRLERRDITLRFGRALDLANDSTLKQYFDISPGVGEVAWVLDDTNAITGVSHRITVSHSEAEIALIVRSDLKRLGIGEFLLRQMLVRSAQDGLSTLSASVFQENRPMLKLVDKIGYVPRQTSAWTVEVIFELSRPTTLADHSQDRS